MQQQNMSSNCPADDVDKYALERKNACQHNRHLKRLNYQANRAGRSESDYYEQELQDDDERC